MNLTRKQKAMIFTIKLLSDFSISGCHYKLKDEDSLKDFHPTTDEIEKCVEELIKKGYLSQNV